jgi:hypothetical protein
MQTHVPFTLPLGVLDEHGETHRDGVMRLATARDEIQPLGDAAVRRNEAYLTVLLLARTVEQIGPIHDVTPDVIEGLYAADFDHLQRLYERLNTAGDLVGSVACPDCKRDFEVDLTEIQDGSPGK